MIQRIVIRHFKRFREAVLNVPDNIVLAGPNNTGKTTVLQAVAAWSLAHDRWKQHNDFQRHGGSYTKVPIARQAFSAVPLRTFDLLWRGRRTTTPIEIQIQTNDWSITMELIPDSTEQIFVRPKNDVEPVVVRRATLSTAFVPAMSGLSTEEPLYARRETVDALMGQSKPGDVLRNLLVEVHQDDRAWQSLLDAIQRLFGFELLPPEVGAFIAAEYRRRPDGPRFDIASAGSGFQQVLMLLTFLYTRPKTILLLDEPDAHLHVILQDAIYGELRTVAAKQKSQLIIATHSEVIINSVEPREICLMLQGKPRMLADTDERQTLIKSLASLSNEDILLALGAPGVLYLEDYTDLEILRAWARILKHPADDLLTRRLFWKPVVWQPHERASGVRSRDHYEALKLVRDDLPGLELVDGDANPGMQPTPIEGVGLQRLRWRRYEIESYLVHPAALERFVESQIGPRGHSVTAKQEMRAYIEKTLKADYLNDPLEENPLVDAYLEKRKARTEVLPPILDAAGLIGFPYTRYDEIAAVMLPGEIHPEVKEKLDLIMKAFRL